MFTKEIKDIKNWNRLVAIALIIILGFAIYANSLTNKFVYDDFSVVKDNTLIISWGNIKHLFNQNYYRRSGEVTYRPMVTLTYFLDYSIWGRKPFGFHLTNVILHILNGILLYFFLIHLLTWFKREPFWTKSHYWLGLPLLAFLFFIVHPIQTESVNAISFREELLFTSFFFLSLIMYLKMRITRAMNPRRLYYLSSLCFYLLSCLAKEMAFTLPLIIVLIDLSSYRSLEGKDRIRSYAGYLLVAAIYLYIRFFFMANRVTAIAVEPLGGSRYLALLSTAPIILTYLRLLLFPAPLYAEHIPPVFHSLTEPAVYLSILFIFFLLFLLIRNRKRPLLFFSGLWFFVTLLPVANIIPIHNPMAERYLYLPSVGFFILLGYAFILFYRKGMKIRVIPITILIGLIGLYSSLTIKQNRYWNNSVALWERTLRFAPDSSRVHYNLGNAYSEMGKYEEAIASYQKSIEIKLDYAEAYNNLGNTYSEIGKYEESIAAHQKAIKINPNYALAHYNLGKTYKNIGKYEEAIASFKKAIESNLNYAPAHYNLGNAYSEMGKYEEAIASYKSSIAINPKYAPTHYCLADAYSQMDQYEEAIASYQKSIEINSTYSDAYSNLGVVYNTIGKHKEAIASFKKSIEINPNCAEVHNNLAVAYYYEKEYDLAIIHCDKAVSLGCSVHPEFLELLKPYR